jgi:elongation factor G
MEDENSITEEEINKALRAAVMDMAIIPMIAGSFKIKSSIHVRCSINTCLPVDKDSIEGIHPDDADLLEEDQTKIMRKPDVKEPFAALAFKIATDPFVGRLAFSVLIQDV